MIQTRSLLQWSTSCTTKGNELNSARPGGRSWSSAIPGIRSRNNSKCFAKESYQKSMKTNLPTVVLICHEGDRLDTEGLASWLAGTMNLAGLIVISDQGRRLWTAARRELRRVGWLGFFDVLAYRAYARLRLRSAEDAWKTRQIDALKQQYPVDLADVP